MKCSVLDIHGGIKIKTGRWVGKSSSLSNQLCILAFKLLDTLSQKVGLPHLNRSHFQWTTTTLMTFWAEGETNVFGYFLQENFWGYDGVSLLFLSVEARLDGSHIFVISIKLGIFIYFLNTDVQMIHKFKILIIELQNSSKY